MDTKKIKLKQLNQKLQAFQQVQTVAIPPAGWVKAIRTSLGMTLQQLANKLGITQQSVQELEKREKEMGITLKSLNDVANAMDMQLVYALVPKDGSLDALIERKANQMAKEIVMRTSQNMSLEDQKNSQARLTEAVEERKTEIIQQLPKTLWD